MPAQYPGNSATKAARAASGGGFESAMSTPAGDTLQYIFSDDFSSGDMLKTENGFQWMTGNSWTVETTNPKTGTHSAQIRYQALGIDAEDSAQYYFDLGALYKTVRMEFDLYIPDGTEPWGGASYYHRDSGGTDNNKFFRLWGDDTPPNDYTNSKEKIGASTWPDTENVPAGLPGDSMLRTQWTSSYLDFQSQRARLEFITDADRGQWMSLLFEFKMASGYFATQEESDGYYKIVKNGVTIYDEPMANYRDEPGYNHAWKIGNLFGYANASFEQETLLFLDNFKVSGVPK